MVNGGISFDLHACTSQKRLNFVTTFIHWGMGGYTYSYSSSDKLKVCQSENLLHMNDSAFVIIAVLLVTFSSKVSIIA